MVFERAFGAAIREVGKGESKGRPTHLVRASRTYPTSQADLWTAITERHRIELWFGNVSGDFRPGGRFSVEGNADGEITSCDPPNMSALTWEFGGKKSWVTATIQVVEDGALLTLEHELPTDDESEAHWEKYGPGVASVKLV